MTKITICFKKRVIGNTFNSYQPPKAVYFCMIKGVISFKEMPIKTELVQVVKFFAVKVRAPVIRKYPGDMRVCP